MSGTLSGTLAANSFTAVTVYAGTLGNTNALLTGYLTTAAQPNVTSLGTLTSLTVNNTIAANAYTANAMYAGTLGNTGTTLTGTLSTNAQPNITSVGQLTSLNVTGTATANQLQAGLVGNSGALLQGTLITAAQGNITSVGQLTSLNVTGTATANQLQAGLVGNSGALLQGTLITAAQPNITSTGTLTSLNVTNTVTANIYTGAAVYAGNIGNTGATLTGATLTLTGQANMANTAISSVYITGGVYWQANGNPIGSYSPLAIAAGGNTMMQFNNAGTTYGSTYLQYNITSGNLVSNSTTTSTSTTTGALVVPSVGASGNVNANAFYSNYFLYSNGSTIVTPPSGANTFIQFNSSGSFGGANYLQYNITSGNLVSNSTTISTSQTTGALVLSGGVGVGGAINAANVATTPVAPNPTNGINTFGLYTSGSYGGGIGLLDGTWGWSIYDTFGQLNFGNSTGATGSVTQRIQFGNTGTIAAYGNITAQSGNLYAAYVVANTAIVGTIQTVSQTNITGLGTITSGTWNGTIIGSTYGGTGVNNGSNQLTLSGGSYTINQSVAQGASPLFSAVSAGTIGNSGATLTGLTASINTISAGVIGNTSSTLLQGTLITAAQGNVTSVGTLTGLTVSGTTNLQGTTNGTTINGTSILATTIGNTASAINGNTYTGSAIYAGTIGNTGASLVGTLSTAAQTNITSVGTLTGLTVSGTTNLQGTTNGATINGTSILGTTIGNTASAINGNIHTGSAIYAGTIGNTGAVHTGATATFNGGVSQVGTNFNTNPASIDAGRIFSIYNTNYLPGASYSSSDTRIFDFGVTTGNIAYIRTGGGNGLQLNAGGNGFSFNNAILPTANASINIGGTGTNYWNNIYGVTLTGTLLTAAQTNITSVGTLSALTVTATITGSVTGNAGSATQLQNSRNINGVSFNGTADITVHTAGTGISISGTTVTNTGVTSAVAGTGVSVSGSTGAVTFSIGQAVGTGNSPTFAGLTIPSITHSGTSGTGDIGTSGQVFGTVYATATSAQYADLAEKYLPDTDYAVGTVVMVGGEAEITAHTGENYRAIGVVSANPAYKMNDGLEGGTYIALKGRVPVFVSGPVRKGDNLKGNTGGTAIVDPDLTTKSFAIALETDNGNGVRLIEAVIL